MNNSIDKFEDLKCWKAARVLTKNIYKLSSTGQLGKDFDFRSQLRRASISVMNNIAEGFGRYSRKESIRFLDFAQSSAAEVKSMLYVMEDINYLPQNELKELHEQVDKSRGLCLGFIRYLRNNQN